MTNYQNQLLTTKLISIFFMNGIPLNFNNLYDALQWGVRVFVYKYISTAR